MYTIGDLCNKFKLSRSTILYYEKMELLKPAFREDNNYRIYDENQVKKLEKIILYREAGVSVKEIQGMVNTESSQISSILLNRLENIQSEIDELKKQEKLVIDVLKEEVIYRNDIKFTPKTWGHMLMELGYDEESTYLWHKEFEEENSKMHREFLRSLSMSEEDINKLIIELEKYPRKKGNED